ncbi:MAG: glycosyltransferase family 39 protein [Candidatus Margulisbacteria bacterium]|nr:glycosyltransferase family 39 protein [Candidatus Margulisiibacteriota bacterium]
MKLSPFWKGFVFVLIAALLAGGVVFISRVLAGDAFNREEAQHALYGMWLARDIKALDIGSFWYDTQRQMVWPFLHSWVLSFFFLVFGTSYLTARLLSWALFLAAVILIYLISTELCDEKGWRVGIVASLLALTSPIMIRFAAENMIEGLGALLFMATAGLYMISEERKITVEYVLLAFLIGLSIYTNYLYAYLLIPAFIVMTLVRLGPLTFEAVQLRRRGEKEAVHFVWWSYRKFIVLGVLLFLCGSWFSFSFSRKIFLLYNTIFKYSGGTVVEGWLPNLIYYPKVIISDLAFSPWIGVLMLAALFLPRVASRYHGLNRLYIYVWTVLLLLTLTISAKTPQMIYIIVPFILIIFSGVVVYLFDSLKRTNKAWAYGLAAVILIPALISLPRFGGLYLPEQGEGSMIKALDYFQATVPGKAGIVSMLNLKRLNPEVVKFHFRDWPGEIIAETQFSGEEIPAGETYFLSLEIDANSPYQADILDDSLYRWNAWLKDREMDGRIRLYSVKRFDGPGLTAKIFRSNP